MDQEKIWDFYQNNDQIGNFAFNANSRYQYITSFIEKGKKVLNIGVGRGGLEHLLISKGIEVYCLDPNVETILNIRKHYNMGERAQAGYSQQLPFADNLFDIVVMSEVLEHLDNDVLSRTIDELKRVLKTDGIVIGTVPADENLQDSLVICPCCGSKFHRWGHVQSFSKNRIRELFNGKLTFKLLERRYFSNYDELNWKGKLSLSMKLALLKLGIYGNGETWFFIAKNTL